jgi:hypothetical protein
MHIRRISLTAGPRPSCWTEGAVEGAREIAGAPSENSPLRVCCSSLNLIVPSRNSPVLQAVIFHRLVEQPCPVGAEQMPLDPGKVLAGEDCSRASHLRHCRLG